MIKHIFWALLFIGAVVYLSFVWMWIEEGNRHFNCTEYYKGLDHAESL